MKGPFATKEEAYSVAEAGEIVMVRDSAKWREAGWCVMGDVEASCHFNAIFSDWVIWEVI